MARIKGVKKPIADYWFEHYVQNGHCSLCGNSGTIDTRGVRTPVGYIVGRLNYCICPNGQVLRYHQKNAPITLQNEKKKEDPTTNTI